MMLPLPVVDRYLLSRLRCVLELAPHSSRNITSYMMETSGLSSKVVVQELIRLHVEMT